MRGEAEREHLPPQEQFREQRAEPLIGQKSLKTHETT